MTRKIQIAVLFLLGLSCWIFSSQYHYSELFFPVDEEMLEVSSKYFASLGTYLLGAILMVGAFARICGVNPWIFIGIAVFGFIAVPYI